MVDLEGGEFMHGNILDANSTNKLISQSVKDAVDDKFIESGHVTKDLLEAETSARTKGDEDLSAKIKAEQTRAEGKEKEISDKLAIVDGDSNTEGSFRKAIADVIAAYALKTELPTVPTKTSQLTNDSNFIAVDNVDDNNYTLQRGLKIGNEADGYSTIGKDGITVGNREEGFDIDGVNITNYSKTISIDPD